MKEKANELGTNEGGFRPSGAAGLRNPDKQVATTGRKTVGYCNECGRSVEPGSGNWVNRIHDLNDPKTRKEMLKPFPYGDFICAQCDARWDAEEENDSYTCNNCQKTVIEPAIMVASSEDHFHDPLWSFCSMECFAEFYRLGGR
ncbi:MAG: hypothetical protein JRM72_04050 [Nitrososphaerota archaeon]|jgi:predicted RNA-binding Zn-ribbon protein involved in translation (DUF1610 family)|nr:hypothetical protein [Nitrososphaerota archaeon]